MGRFDDIRGRIEALEAGAGRGFPDIMFAFRERGEWPSRTDECDELARWLEMVTSMRIQRPARPDDAARECSGDQACDALLAALERARVGDVDARAHVFRLYRALSPRGYYVP